MRHDPARLDPATYPFRFTLDVRFGDMDVNAHLNNVAFLRFFEEGRVRFHQHMGGRTKLGFRPIVANINVDFLAEGSWPEVLTICAGVRQIGNSSYVIAQAVFQSSRCIALSDTVMVNRAEDGPGGAPIPKTLRAGLEGMRLAASAT